MLRTDKNGIQLKGDTTSKTCVCPDPLILNEDETECICPTTTAPYMFKYTENDEDKYICCPSGYTPLKTDSGFSCKQIVCSGGPAYYWCHIDGSLCGYHCDSSASNCWGGYCYKEDCDSDEEFEYISSSSYHYQCCKNIDGMNCCRIYPGYYTCTTTDDFKNACMTISRPLTGEANGVCTDDVCAIYGGTLVNFQNSDTPYWCSFDDNLICRPHYTNYKTTTIDYWECRKNSYLCASKCTETDPKKCCPNATGCPSGMTYDNDINSKYYEFCVDTEKFCTTKKGSYGQNCYLLTEIDKAEKERQVCAWYTYTGSKWRGYCSDPGCSEYTFNGEKLTWGYLSSGFYGCKTEDNLFQSVVDYVYYNGKTCGESCKMDGTDCQVAYLPQCAKAGYCPQTGYKIDTNDDGEDDCICDGQVSSGYCCPAYHKYINGQCALQETCSTGECKRKDGSCGTCDEGEICNTNGYCILPCSEDGYRISDNECVCNGKTTTISGIKYCCKKDQYYSNGKCISS